MTRDIIDINNFIVLIEQSNTEETVVETCGFADSVLGIAFYGSGKVALKISLDDYHHQLHNTKGMAISFYGDTRTLFEHTVSPEQPLQCVCIVTSMKNLQKLPSMEQEIFREHLSKLINPLAPIVGGPGFYMTPEMQSAVDKIFNTSYKGTTRMMFLRSQVTELLSHFFAGLADAATLERKDPDRDKLYQVKDILADNLVTPPSLTELSKLIGLNSYKLKKNFKELFGVPVFKHLQNERLNKAHDLLRNGNTTIQEAAWGVGYESLSSFSNAFTKKFGFRPSEVIR